MKNQEIFEKVDKIVKESNLELREWWDKANKTHEIEMIGFPEELTKRITNYITTNFIPKDKILEMVEIDVKKATKAIRHQYDPDTLECDFEGLVTNLIEAGVIKIKDIYDDEKTNGGC